MNELTNTKDIHINKQQAERDFHRRTKTIRSRTPNRENGFVALQSEFVVSADDSGS